ncbi:MAG: hypothetical protein WC121_05510 [Candidatus Kapaibacterium sp.]|jgi:hypothetical protein
MLNIKNGDIIGLIKVTGRLIGEYFKISYEDMYKKFPVKQAVKGIIKDRKILFVKL